MPCTWHADHKHYIQPVNSQLQGRNNNTLKKSDIILNFTGRFITAAFRKWVCFLLFDLITITNCWSGSFWGHSKFDSNAYWLYLMISCVILQQRLITCILRSVRLWLMAVPSRLEKADCNHIWTCFDTFLFLSPIHRSPSLYRIILYPPCGFCLAVVSIWSFCQTLTTVFSERDSGVFRTVRRKYLKNGLSVCPEILHTGSWHRSNGFKWITFLKIIIPDFIIRKNCFSRFDPLNFWNFEK